MIRDSSTGGHVASSVVMFAGSGLFFHSNRAETGAVEYKIGTHREDVLKNSKYAQKLAKSRMETETQQNKGQAMAKTGFIGVPFYHFRLY